MKKRLFRGCLVALICSFCLSSCTTLFYGSKGSTTITSIPENTTVDKLVIQRGKKKLEVANVTFPYRLPNKFGRYFKETTVTAYKDGKEYSVIIDKKFNSVGLFIVDACFYFTGAIVDLATGSSAKPAQKSYTINLEKEGLSLAENTSDKKEKRKKKKENKSVIKNLLVAEAKSDVKSQAQPQPEFNLQAQSQPRSQQSLSDVDKNIPVTGKNAENTFVLIIANENYAFVDDVEFALNDGRIFKEYCVKTLGVPEKQVWLYENASFGILNAGVSKMVQAMNLFDNPNAIIYYCGHGIPDEKTNDAYIIPTDGNGKNMATCYSLNTLYKTFAKTQAAQVTYFMDACFTGASKDGSMLVAARGVAREPKKEVLTGKSVVFSATSADETAMSYKEKQHGLFTYYLLKKLQETKGDVNYEELSQYINKNVKKEAFLTNEKPQTPVVATSPALKNTWKTIKLK